MSWSGTLTELWRIQDVTGLQAYAGRLGEELVNNPRPPRAARLRELQASASAIVATIQEADAQMVAEDETGGAITSFFSALAARRR